MPTQRNAIAVACTAVYSKILRSGSERAVFWPRSVMTTLCSRYTLLPGWDSSWSGRSAFDCGAAERLLTPDDSRSAGDGIRHVTVHSRHDPMASTAAQSTAANLIRTSTRPQRPDGGCASPAEPNVAVRFREPGVRSHRRLPHLDSPTQARRVPRSGDRERGVSLEPAEFVRLAGEFCLAGGVRATAECVVRLGPPALGCRWVALVQEQRAQLSIVAVSGAASPLSSVLDIATRRAEGAEHTTVTNRERTVVTELSADSRWPRYATAVTACTSVRAILGMPLTFGGKDFGALMCYDPSPGHFDAEKQASAAVYAGHASMALAKATDYQAAANLRQALATSREIGQAVGILMNAWGITDEQAFDVLRRTSHHTATKVRELAAAVVLTGRLPAPPVQQLA